MVSLMITSILHYRFTTAYQTASTEIFGKINRKQENWSAFGKVMGKSRVFCFFLDLRGM